MTPTCKIAGKANLKTSWTITRSRDVIDIIWRTGLMESAENTPKPRLLSARRIISLCRSPMIQTALRASVSRTRVRMKMKGSFRRVSMGVWAQIKGPLFKEATVELTTKTVWLLRIERWTETRRSLSKIASQAQTIVRLKAARLQIRAKKESQISFQSRTVQI